MKYYSLLILFILSCNQVPERTVQPSFYHWKNEINLTPSENQYIYQLGVNKLYVRFFDVDWKENRAVPLSIVNIKTALPDSLNIVPTIFITNRTLINLEESEIPNLVENLRKKILQISKSFINNAFREVQFDCDWSEKSREKYFELLRQIKQLPDFKEHKISATIRLHQIKYFEKTGVPEVDRGILMFYNMGEVDNPKTANSIIDLSIAKQYLVNFQKYPIPLDLALPIFKWGIIYQDDNFVRIINNLDEVELQDSSRFNKIDKSRFEVLKSTYLKGYYLYQKDQIRLEKVEPEQLEKVADLLSKELQTTDLNIIFYHLDSTLISDFSHETLENICNRFY